MIITKTYLSKCNTIIKDNPSNLSLNPILELNYGKKFLTRGLIYFDHEKLKKLVEDKVYPDVNKLHHVLKMTNASSIPSVHNRYISPCDKLQPQLNTIKERAVSFDLIFFKIPYKWDDGKGFNYMYDVYLDNGREISTQASNWYQYKNYHRWDNDGIYDIDRLFNEYDLFTSKKGNLSDIIIAKQHFEYGNENIKVDITDIVNKFIKGEEINNGLGIAFAPYYENIETRKTQYVGFFTQHTNSFFEPYIETTYNEYIEDDRTNFYLDKNNKLYFYASINGSFVNLDQIPTCMVNNTGNTVKQASKGIYYIEINLSSTEYESDTMLYDVWDNIIYNGVKFPPTELSFVTKNNNNYFSFGLPSNRLDNQEIIPSLYGIDDNEQIQQGDIRKVNVDCKIPYTSNVLLSVEGLFYRLYVKEGENQIDVIDWTQIERGYNENYFYINTSELIPHRYYLDIKIHKNNEIILKNEIVEFDIVNNITDKTN